MNTTIIKARNGVPGGTPARTGETPVAPSSELLTREELAVKLKVSVRTVDRIIANGEIPVRRVRGKVVRFLQQDVERYLEGETRDANCTN